MQWIKEVELVYSVDELRTLSSTRGISMPIFEVLDARIASSLNKIIRNSHFRRWISLEEQKAQKQDRFFRDRLLTWSTSISGSLGAMILSKTTPTCSLLFFEMTIFRNYILSGTEFYCPWRRSRMMTSWKDCTKLRIREFEKFKTVVELYDLQSHQKKLGPDDHRLKTMAKRSFEQGIRNKNFGNRIGNFEKIAVVKNQGNKTAWTKKSRRLLAMGSHRVVFERGQFQFPTRYE